MLLDRLGRGRSGPVRARGRGGERLVRDGLEEGSSKCRVWGCVDGCLCCCWRGLQGSGSGCGAGCRTAEHVVDGRRRLEAEIPHMGFDAHQLQNSRPQRNPSDLKEPGDTSRHTGYAQWVSRLPSRSRRGKQRIPLCISCSIGVKLSTRCRYFGGRVD